MPKKCRQSDLPPDAIERCVRTVNLVLRSHGNRDEAVAAIDRLFGEEPPPPPSLESSVHDIGLRLRTASMLDEEGILIAADLKRALGCGRLWSIAHFGPAAIDECRRAIRSLVANPVQPQSESDACPVSQRH
jgi:hypothetical protein